MIKHYCHNCGVPLEGDYPHNSPHCSLRCAVWSRVEPAKPQQCWEWAGSVNRTGYGTFVFGENKRRRLAHRTVMELIYGTQPTEVYVCHTCDNRLCCNPNHLWLGDAKQNFEDAVQKGRMPAKPDPRIGQTNGNAKATDEMVLAIRAEYAKGDITQVALAKKYGISPAMTGYIVRGDYWTHLPLIPAAL